VQRPAVALFGFQPDLPQADTGDPIRRKEPQGGIQNLAPGRLRAAWHQLLSALIGSDATVTREAGGSADDQAFGLLSHQYLTAGRD
jgi:hypothetical protein